MLLFLVYLPASSAFGPFQVFEMARSSRATSVSIFHKLQSNLYVGIIKHQLGYKITKNILRRQLISEEGEVKESSGAPQRSEAAHSDTRRNLILPLQNCLERLMIYCFKYQSNCWLQSEGMSVFNNQSNKQSIGIFFTLKF